MVFIFAALAPGGPFLLPIVKLKRAKSSLFPNVLHHTSQLVSFGFLLVPGMLAHSALAQESPATLPFPPQAVPGAVESDAPISISEGSTTATASPVPSETPLSADDKARLDANTELPTRVMPESLSSPHKRRRVSSGRDLPAPAKQPSQIFAAEINTVNGVITAQGTPENPVRFVSGAGELRALHIQLDTNTQVLDATGAVHFERLTPVQQKALLPKQLKRRKIESNVTETLDGQDLHYDFKSSTGKLDKADVQLAAISVTADSVLLNGKRLTANNVIVIPGALTDAERKIYGTPPLNIRAKKLEATQSDTPGKNNVVAKGGGLYFRKTRLLPLPSYVFRAGLGGGGGDDNNYSLTPGISFNSADRVLVTTKVSFPLAKDPKKLSTSLDVGLSERVGIRGGVGLESDNNLGRFQLRAREHDIVTTQLTNRIELDRLPEFNYRSNGLATFPLPGGRLAGFRISGSYGDYAERTIGENASAIRSTRAYGRLVFTTRLKSIDGPFLDLFTSTAHYGEFSNHYNSRGYTVGYEGDLISRVHGRVSYSSTNLSGNTPFRFDEIEIAKELRSTFDIELTPRYLLPVDLRYDLSRHDFRDKTFGILRSYKTFAYGIVYQTARKDLRLEVRQGF